MSREEFEMLLRQKFNEEDIEKIMLAYRLAKYGHRQNKRKSGERYFEHLKGAPLSGVFNFIVVHLFLSARMCI